MNGYQIEIEWNENNAVAVVITLDALNLIQTLLWGSRAWN